MNARLHSRLRAGSITCAALMAGMIGGFATPQAQADDGRVRIAHSYVIHYRHLDLSFAEDRLALLTQIETAAEDYCDVPLPRGTRRDCARKAVDQALKDAPDTVSRAMALARLDRDGAM